MSEIELKKYRAEIMKIKLEVIHITLKSVVIFGTIVATISVFATLAFLKG